MVIVSIISLTESFLSTIRLLGASHFRAFLTSESYKLDSSKYKLCKFKVFDE